MKVRSYRRMPRRPTCDTCKGAGALEIARVVGLRVQFEEESCPSCGGEGR